MQPQYHPLESSSGGIEGFLFFGSVLTWVAIVGVYRDEKGFYYDFAKANAELAEKQASREFWGKYSTVPEEVLELKPLH